MTRIAAGVLIVGAVLAMSGVLPQRLSAAELQPQGPALRAGAQIEVREVVEARGAGVAALLMTLGALRPSPVPATR